jgi:hypothetical protein
MFTRHYLDRLNFAYTRVSGSADDGQLLEHHQAMQRETAGKHAMLELADCRDVTDLTHLTSAGTIQVAKLDAISGYAINGRLAILVADQLAYGLARTYQVFASEIREACAVTYDFDEAIKLLGLSNRPEIIEFIESRAAGVEL